MKKTLVAALFAVGTLAASSASAFVLGPTVPGKWGPPAMGTGATITYSFMATGTSCADEFFGCTISALADFMPVGYMGAITSALASWSAVADLSFVMVADDGAAFNTAVPDAGLRGNLRFGGHTFDGPFSVLAHGYYPPVNGATAAGDMHYDIDDTWKIGFGGPGFDIFQVTAHEIGHALGLDHTAVPDSLMNPFYTEAFAGPQADDIAGMQFIYGPAVTAVPEPSTAALLGLVWTVSAFGALRRRSRAARATVAS